MAVSGPCVNFWVFLSNDNIKVRKVHVNNCKHQGELEFFIEQLNKTAYKEIGVRDTVTIENPPLQLATEEEVVNDVIRVDVRYSQSCALKKLHDIIVSPIADLIEGNELTFHDELCSRKEFSPGMRKMIHRLVKVKREGSISK